MLSVLGRSCCTLGHRAHLHSLTLSPNFCPNLLVLVHRRLLPQSDRDDGARSDGYSSRLSPLLGWLLFSFAPGFFSTEQTAANNDLCGGGGASSAGAPTAAC